MTIGYTARLTRGGYSLDISTGRYSLAQFTPPTATEIVNVAGGLSSNRTQGSQLAGRRAVNGQMSFAVRVLGASQAEVDAGANDLANFLRLAGDEAEPLYLEFCPHGYVTFAPKWGQDQWRRMEIVHAEPYKSDIYFLAEIRSKAQIVTIEAEIKPYVLGLRQRLAAAVGGVFEDWIGSATGLPRGVRVPEVTTNKATNPIFGHATFGNGWTAGANVTATANYDKRFILFGRVSAKLVGIHATTTNIYTQSIDADSTATHAISLYVKKADGSAVTASDCKCYEEVNGELASTYQALGDGWYRVYSTFTATDAAKKMGIALKSVGAGLYLAGFQVEALAYPTLLAHGDMMGCAWTGTAHASASTRTAASLAIDTHAALNVIEGSARAVLEMDCTQTSGTFTVFQHFIAAAFIDCYFNAADDKFYLTDGTNTISSAAQTFAVGDKIILHATWKTGALNLYKNGANIATGSTYTPPLGTGNIFIGAANDATENLRGLVLGFETWDRAMSASEVLSDYGNVYQIAADGGRVSCIPWVHNGGAITFGNHLTTIAGIPGSVDADTTLEITQTNATYGNDLYINQNPMPRYSGFAAGGVNTIYCDMSTAVAVTTSAVLFDDDDPIIIDYDYDMYQGKQAYILAQFADTSASAETFTAAAASWIFEAAGPPTSTTIIVGAYRITTMAGSADENYIFGPVKLPSSDNYSYLESVANMKGAAALYLATITGGNRNITPNWMQLMVDRVCWIKGASTPLVLRIRGRKTRGYVASTGLYQLHSTVLGDVIELTPNMINHMAFLSTTNDIASLTDITLGEISIIPRWLMS